MGQLQDFGNQIFRGKLRHDKALEWYKKEEYGDPVHRKGFDEPVGDPGNKQTLWVLAHVLDALEIHPHHHWVRRMLR